MVVPVPVETIVEIDAVLIHDQLPTAVARRVAEMLERIRGRPLEEFAIFRDLTLDLDLVIEQIGSRAPSTTRVREQLAVRVNITNHRCQRTDFDVLLDAVLAAGRRRAELCK